MSLGFGSFVLLASLSAGPKANQCGVDAGDGPIFAMPYRGFVYGLPHEVGQGLPAPQLAELPTAWQRVAESWVRHSSAIPTRSIGTALARAFDELGDPARVLFDAVPKARLEGVLRFALHAGESRAAKFWLSARLSQELFAASCPVEQSEDGLCLTEVEDARQRGICGPFPTPRPWPVTRDPGRMAEATTWRESAAKALKPKRRRATQSSEAQQLMSAQLHLDAAAVATERALARSHPINLADQFPDEVRPGGQALSDVDLACGMVRRISFSAAVQDDVDEAFPLYWDLYLSGGHPAATVASREARLARHLAVEYSRDSNDRERVPAPTGYRGFVHCDSHPSFLYESQQVVLLRSCVAVGRSTHGGHTIAERCETELADLEWEFSPNELFGREALSPGFIVHGPQRDAPS